MASVVFLNKFSKICKNLENFTGSLATRRYKTLLYLKKNTTVSVIADLRAVI